MRPGVGVSIPLSKQWSVDGDISHVCESAFDFKAWRSEIGLTRSFEHGWSLTGDRLDQGGGTHADGLSARVRPLALTDMMMEDNGPLRASVGAFSNTS